MINRVADYPSSVSAPKAVKAASETSRASASDVRELTEPIEQLILKYPAAALASAFLVGVVLAWWIKRK